MKNNFKVYLLACLTVCLWGISFLFSNTLIKQGVPTEFFVPVRIFLTAAALFMANLIERGNLKFMRIHRGDIWKFFLMSLFEPFLYYMLEGYGIVYTGSPAFCSLIIGLIPMFSVLVGVVFLKEKLSKTNAVGVFVSLIGIILVTLKRPETNPTFFLGVGLLLLAVFAEVGYASMTNIISKGYSALTITMYQFLLGSIWFIPVFIHKGLPAYDPVTYLTWSVVGPIVFLTIFCTLLAFTFWTFAIRRLGVAKSGMFQALNPVVTAVVGVMVGQEVLCGWQWVGVGITVLGVLGSQLRVPKKLKNLMA
ncbi:MAG: DMT family transporter [Bacteroidales bacterium]|nr:DMT family transporter [Bacteroidales bacterium]